MSKYPPGQAIFLALGILLGHAHYGVIFSFGLFVMTSFWMLRPVVPMKWALFGAVWALLIFNVQSYWLESYWGGFVGAIGGNLVLGSILYFFCQGRPPARWWFAIGALLLALTRPFEGMAFVVSIFTGFFGWQWFADRRQFVESMRLWAPVVAVTTLLLAIVVGGYNLQTLGSPLRFPYLEHEKQYGVVPVLWPLPLRSGIAFDDVTLERFYKGWSVEQYWRTRERVPMIFLVPFQMLRAGYVGVSVFGLSGVAVVMACFCWRNTTIRILSVALILTGLFVSLEVWLLPHYLAPITGLLITLGVCSLRETDEIIANKGRTLWLVRLIFALALVGPLIQSVRFVYSAKRESVAVGASSVPVRYQDHPRDAIAKQLEAMGGSHVVFVRYSPAHNVHEEWVYNSPDIDSQPVIWARDRGKDNQKLMNYYSGRTFWLIEADSGGAKPQLMSSVEVQ